MKKNNSIKQKKDFNTALGTIDYPFTNDFMFHVIFGENKPVLKKLLCSLLHMQPEEIKSIIVENPIDYGRSITDKKVILDIKIVLNTKTMVNIEMQVLDEKDWPERSVIYLCRSYDNIRKGEEYDLVNAAHHISILDYDLFDDEPEFYSTHHLRNDKTGQLYTGNFTLSVLNLRRIELATDEDKKWKIDRWAALFKAKTWEDLRMIAAQDEEMIIASEKLYDKNQDKLARIWAEAHEAFLWEERIRRKRAEKAEKELAIKEQKIESIEQDLQSKKEELQSRKKELQSKKKELQSKDQELAHLRSLLIANGIDPDA